MRTFDIRVLAKRINLRRQEFLARYPHRQVPITDTLSRILEHDPTYVPMRQRRLARAKPPIRNPGIATLAEIAESLETTVGDLLGERSFAVSISERKTMAAFVWFLTRVFYLDDPKVTGQPPADRREAHGEARSSAGLSPASSGTAEGSEEAK